MIGYLSTTSGQEQTGAVCVARFRGIEYKDCVVKVNRIVSIFAADLP